MAWDPYRDFYGEQLKSFVTRQRQRIERAVGAAMCRAKPFYARHKGWIWATFGLIVCAVVAYKLFGEQATINRATYPNFGSFPYGPSAGHLYGQRFLTLALSGAAGFAIGAFFSPLLRPVRLLVWGLAAIAAVLYAVFGDPPMADTLDDVVAGIAFLVAGSLGLRLGAKAAALFPRRRPTSYGSAKWATFAYLADKGLFGNEGFLLGEFADGYNAIQPLRYKGVRHLLTVAPTRSGKGVSSIIPNLLTYPGSVFVIDPKGENALITAWRRGQGKESAGIAGLGQKVVLLDPWDIAATKLGMRSSGFNPLDWIKAGDPDAAENAFLLADALVVTESAKGDDRFWDEEAKALLTGIILYVATAPEEHENRTLGRVRDVLTLDDAKFREALRAMYRHPHPVVRSTATRTALKEDKLLSSVMASAQSHTHFLDSPRIRESLSRTDIRFEDMKQSAVSVYLILPADRLHTFNRWLRLLIQQAITINARNIEDKPERPILFLLDEMPTLGRLPALEQAYGLMAGFGMQLWGIAQDLSQLARVYGEHGWQTFISNSGMIQYFGSRDKMTAEYFSTLCGVTTIEVHNFSWAVGKALSIASSLTSAMSGNSSTNSNTTSESWTRTSGTSEAQRKLAYPDELMVLKENQQIVFVENLDPIPANKVPWYADPKLKRHGVNFFKPSQEATEAPPALIAEPIESVPASVAAPPEVPDEIARTSSGSSAVGEWFRRLFARREESPQIGCQRVPHSKSGPGGEEDRVPRRHLSSYADRYRHLRKPSRERPTDTKR